MTQPPSERVLGGRYRLLREIARGGMAAIWEAEDTLLDRHVAVKLLHPQFADDPEFLERFRREARAAARLSHPNIVPIYDVGPEARQSFERQTSSWNAPDQPRPESAAFQDSDTRTPYIVMELVDGGNLKDRIRNGPLPDADIRRIGAALAATLEYAHRKGLIHRDVKPQNVLIGDDGRPRLTDFGIAQAATGTGLTRTGAVMGTVRYIAPEVAQGRPASPQSDIYSLGVVLYEMATGRVPFQADTDLAVALAHIQEQPASPRTLNARLAPDLERTIMRALAKSPEMRYASAAHLGEALRRSSNTPAAAMDATQRMPAASAVAVRQATQAQRRAIPATAAPSPFARRTTRPRGRGASNATVGILVAMAAVLLALGAGFYGLATLSRQGVIPPDATPVPTVAPTAAPKPVVAPSNTPVPPTATPVPPSPTPVPPTPSPMPPTSTPVPPSPTPPPPTPAPRLVAIPQLRGKPLDQAQSALTAAGLTVTVRGVNANVDKNIVSDEQPAAGTSVSPGTTVTLLVGTGDTVVPQVANQPAAEAAQTLQNNSFRVLTHQVRDNRVPPGAAVGTLPQAGTPAPRGSEVQLDISAGRGG